MILVSIGAILFGIAANISLIMGVEIPSNIIVIASVIITMFLYISMMCNKRYIGILKNRKFYTKKRRIFTLCFYIGSYLYLILSMGLGIARNRGDI